MTGNPVGHITVATVKKPVAYVCKMGFRERFLTAGVAIPLALWAILYHELSFLALALALQGVCIHELTVLLANTRYGAVLCTSVLM